ncbi:MAG: DUF3891 family protein [Chloroflexota bacterium]
MIRRRDNPSILITQTVHGWVAGQFAAYWGNEQFQIPALTKDVILTAYNHDNGWLEWEQMPQLNASGYARDFVEMPAETHTALWQKSIDRLNAQNPYAALLGSMHARYLVGGRIRGNDEDSAAEKAALQKFVDDVTERGTKLKETLSTVPYFSAACTEPNLSANFRLIQVFDWLSLLVCMNRLTTTTIEDVPAYPATKRLELDFIPLNEQAFTISPWPFSVPEFELVVEMQHLSQASFDNQQAFNQVWQMRTTRQVVYSVRMN